MIEALLGNEFWQQVIRFLFGSSILLLAVWGLESTRLIKRFEIRAYLWRAAVLGSVLLLLPITVPQTPVYYFQTSNSISAASGAPSVSSGEIAEYQASNAVKRLRQPVVDTESSLSARVERIQQPVNYTESSQSEVGSSTAISETVTSVDLRMPSTTTLIARVRESISNLGIPSASTLIAIARENISNLGMSAWLLLWMFGSGIALIRLYMGYSRGIKQLGTRHEYQDNDPGFELFKTLCREARVAKVPKLTQSEQIASPVTLIGNEICLPSWADQSLADSELRSLLAHELGHIRHHDLQLLLATQLLCSLFFFQPLFVLAKNRLIDLSEFLADQSALDQCRNSNAISKALVNCADRIQSQQSFIMVYYRILNRVPYAAQWDLVVYLFI